MAEAAQASKDTLPKPGRVNEGWLHVSELYMLTYLLLFGTCVSFAFDGCGRNVWAKGVRNKENELNRVK